MCHRQQLIKSSFLTFITTDLCVCVCVKKSSGSTWREFFAGRWHLPCERADHMHCTWLPDTVGSLAAGVEWPSHAVVHRPSTQYHSRHGRQQYLAMSCRQHWWLSRTHHQLPRRQYVSSLLLCYSILWRKMWEISHSRFVRLMIVKIYHV